MNLYANVQPFFMQHWNDLMLDTCSYSLVYAEKFNGGIGKKELLWDKRYDNGRIIEKKIYHTKENYSLYKYHYDSTGKTLLSETITHYPFKEVEYINYLCESNNLISTMHKTSKNIDDSCMVYFKQLESGDLSEVVYLNGFIQYTKIHRVVKSEFSFSEYIISHNNNTKEKDTVQIIMRDHKGDFEIINYYESKKLVLSEQKILDTKSRVVKRITSNLMGQSPSYFITTEFQYSDQGLKTISEYIFKQTRIKKRDRVVNIELVYAN